MRDNEMSEDLQYLVGKIYQERGLDFREYRNTTLTRRLSRRLHARGARTYADYCRILDQDPAEYDKLFDDLTINVTSFFRDAAVFRALADVALPALVGTYSVNTDSRKCLRVWSAGCATGQEPYSIAMLLLETLRSEINLWDITIRASDIDAKALQHARDGLFAAKDMEDIRLEMLNRYFDHEDDGFHVKPVLKQLVTFELHDLVSDPPYYNLDMVVCRNVLIYFTPALQSRVLRYFHKGLKEGGLLLLGKAEVLVGETNKLFHCIDKKAKLFQKRPTNL